MASLRAVEKTELPVENYGKPVESVWNLWGKISSKIRNKNLANSAKNHPEFFQNAHEITVFVVLYTALRIWDHLFCCSRLVLQ
jgi:hypothetical protein